MSVEVYLTNVNVLSGDTDWNWACLSFSWQGPAASGSECLADVEVRVPEHLQTIEAIKAHALSSAREFFQLCAAADYSE